LKGLQEQFNIGATALSIFCAHFSPVKLRRLVNKGICFSQVSLKLLVGKVQIIQFLVELQRKLQLRKKKPTTIKPLSSSEHMQINFPEM